jgi:3-deoxy-manno-octulosonate cytidylyltransferase (CMP-KDO synthetase)
MTSSMDFTVLIPARLASTRLPNKPLALIAGVPMVVRVAQRASLAATTQVVVAADHPSIVEACMAHGVRALLTRSDHASGSDRLAEACGLLQLPDDTVVVNVQGDEPLIDPALINACAQELHRRDDCVMSTAAHALTSAAELDNPNIVKVVLDAAGRALYFSRAPIPWWRDGRAAQASTLPDPAPLRHVGLYAYRAGNTRNCAIATGSTGSAGAVARVVARLPHRSDHQCRRAWHWRGHARRLGTRAPALCLRHAWCAPVRGRWGLEGLEQGEWQVE